MTRDAGAATRAGWAAAAGARRAGETAIAFATAGSRRRFQRFDSVVVFAWYEFYRGFDFAEIALRHYAGCSAAKRLRRRTDGRDSWRQAVWFGRKSGVRLTRRRFTFAGHLAGLRATRNSGAYQSSIKIIFINLSRSLVRNVRGLFYARSRVREIALGNYIRPRVQTPDRAPLPKPFRSGCVITGGMS